MHLMSWKKGTILMNDYRITLSQRARDDIAKIADYISLTLLEPYISKKFIKNLRKSIYQLKFFPYKYQIIYENRIVNHCIRCMPYKNYYVFMKL